MGFPLIPPPLKKNILSILIQNLWRFVMKILMNFVLFLKALVRGKKVNNICPTTAELQNDMIDAINDTLNNLFVIEELDNEKKLNATLKKIRLITGLEVIGNPMNNLFDDDVITKDGETKRIYTLKYGTQYPTPWSMTGKALSYTISSANGNCVASALTQNEATTLMDKNSEKGELV